MENIKSRHKIDINCDMGESYGSFIKGQDCAIFPYISSCNLACGFHGGDPYTIKKTIDLALQHNVTIGAHPSYPDLSGFGRRNMDIPIEELTAIIMYQVGALKSMVEASGGKLKYVKPHGALYNRASINEKEALAIITAVKCIDANLTIMGLAQSNLKMWCESENVKFIEEAFGDRRYEIDGSLVNRQNTRATITDPTIASQQIVSIICNNEVKTIDNKKRHLEAQSICIHGDNIAALDILKEVNKKLKSLDIAIKSFA